MTYGGVNGFGRWATGALAAAAMAGAAAAAGGCGSGQHGGGFFADDVGGAGDDAGEAAPPPDLTGDAAPVLTGDGPFSDFPPNPIVDSPSVDGHAFDGVTASPSGGPCLTEPEVGSIYPKNWLRPRFRWVAPSDENVFELRVHADNQTNDLVVLTTDDRWTMPKAMWDALRVHSAGKPMTVTVRGGALAGAKVSQAAVGSSGALGIAPVDAPGTIVYWTTSNGSTLKGFRIGDEAVANVLVPSQLPVNCVACHSSTPDGKFVGMSVADSPTTGNISRIEVRAVDGTASEPSWLTGEAKALLQRTGNELPVFSKAHWTQGDRIALSMLPQGSRTEIVWTDLETSSQDQGKGWGILGRDGDPNPAGAASFSHDGNMVVYSSSPGVGAGTIFDTGDLYTVPYANRQGGAAARVAGADTSQYNEFFASFSPDDLLLAYSRAPAGTTSYNNAQSEVMVVPATGGTATRLKANDPPACTQRTSPGVTNSWPKWSPEVKSADGKSYYFLVFSSTRDKDASGPQLYVTPVVVEGTTITTYAALYLWNQPESENNHTPSWDAFDIPPVPPPR